MNNRLPPKFIVTVIAILSVLCFAGLIFAQELKAAPLVEDVSDLKQEQAKKYRELGVELQQTGNLTEALSFYQKAIVLNPGYAAAYNDSGVIYELTGFPEQAKESYLKSIKIDPAYLSAYTNLALFYEGQRDLEKAVFYWAKRAELGSGDDPWTQKAANRLRDVRMSLSGKPFADEREINVLGLMKDIIGDKTEPNQNDTTIAQRHFKKAKLSFNRGDMAMAIKEALDAEYLDPNNQEIKAFIEKTELRALTR